MQVRPLTPPLYFERGSIAGGFTGQPLWHLRQPMHLLLSIWGVAATCRLSPRRIQPGNGRIFNMFNGVWTSLKSGMREDSTAAPKTSISSREVVP